MNAVAAYHNCIEFVTIIANSTPAIVTVDGSHGRSVVSCGQDSLIPYNDRSHCLFNAPASCLENLAQRNKILIKVWPVLSEYLFVIL